MKIENDLGTFEGYNLKTQTAIVDQLSAQDVVDWNHDIYGEAEFWPSGDCQGLALLIDGNITANELALIDKALSAFDDYDPEQSFIKIRIALDQGIDLESIDSDCLDDLNYYVYSSTQSFFDLRRGAAYELLEIRYPEAYEACVNQYIPGLDFDCIAFLDSFRFDEYTLEKNNHIAVILE